MKILFLIHSLTLGGTERRILELIRHLNNNSSYTMLLVLTQPIIHYDYISNLNINIEVVQRKFFKKDPLFFFRLFTLCRKFRPDVIHSWSSLTTFYSIPYSVVFNIPIIDGEITNSNPNFKRLSFKGLIIKTNIFFSKIIVANSYAGLLSYKIKLHKGKVIYNGISLDRFINLPDPIVIRAKYNLNTRFCIAMVAEFNNNKNYDLFIEVAKLMLKLRPDVTFIGVGDGPTFQHIKDRIFKENITNVLLTGKLVQVEPLINCTDIGILLTYSEGLSNALMEFMALGKPVITNDFRGGSRELIEDGKYGYVVNNQNAEFFVSLLSNLINDESKRSIMGGIGKSIIAEKFNSELMGSKFIELYNKILKTKI